MTYIVVQERIGARFQQAEDSEGYYILDTTIGETLKPIYPSRAAAQRSADYLARVYAHVGRLNGLERGRRETRWGKTDG